MKRIKEKIELINHYDNDLNEGLKSIIKDIVEDQRQELEIWMNTMIVQNNIERYNIGV